MFSCRLRRIDTYDTRNLGATRPEDAKTSTILYGFAVYIVWRDRKCDGFEELVHPLARVKGENPDRRSRNRGSVRIWW